MNVYEMIQTNMLASLIFAFCLGAGLELLRMRYQTVSKGDGGPHVTPTQTPDAPASDPSTCLCGAKTSKVQWFADKFVPIEIFLNKQLKTASRKKLSIFQKQLALAQERGDPPEAMSSILEKARAEYNRCATKTLKSKMLCRLCWKVQKRHLVPEDVQKLVCYNHHHTPTAVARTTFGTTGEFLGEEL
jgi:hypothetical protein